MDYRMPIKNGIETKKAIFILAIVQELNLKGFLNLINSHNYGDLK